MLYSIQFPSLLAETLLCAATKGSEGGILMLVAWFHSKNILFVGVPLFHRPHTLGASIVMPTFCVLCKFADDQNFYHHVVFIQIRDKY